MIPLLLGVALAGTGWRGDGTGSFDADPPVHWSPRHNVAWKTELPAWSNASPIVVGDLVVVTAEPHTLIGVGASTGAIRWTHPHPAAEALGSEVRERAQAAQVRLGQLAEEILAAQRSVSQLRRDARRGTLDDDLRAKLDGQTAALDELRRQQQALTARYPAIEGEALPETVDDFVGLSSSTPVSDGSRIFAVFGNGVVAAHDLAGELLWTTWAGRPAEEMLGFYDGHAASPVLAGDTLIVGVGTLQGLDPATGAVRWTGAPYRDFGTPAVVDLGGESAVATARGQLIRARDGASLGSVDSELWYVGPTVSGDLLWTGNTDGVTAIAHSYRPDTRQRRWATKLPSERYYGATSTLAGRHHLVSRFGHVLGLDATTGAITARGEFEMAAAEEVYSSPSVAAGRIYVSSSRGRTLVLEPGEDGYREVGRNELEPFRSSIVFAGDAAYVRGFTHLWCLRTK